MITRIAGIITDATRIIINPKAFVPCSNAVDGGLTFSVPAISLERGAGAGLLDLDARVAADDRGAHAYEV